MPTSISLSARSVKTESACSNLGGHYLATTNSCNGNPCIDQRTYDPTADALVYQGSPAQNYGSSNALYVGDVQGAGFTNRSYLKFDVSNLIGNYYQIHAAELYVRTSDSLTTDDENHLVAAWEAGSTDWCSGDDESCITWNNQPGLGVYQSNAYVYQPWTWYSWDVTVASTGALVPGSGILSLALAEWDESTSSYVAFQSSESGGTTSPYVVIEYTPDD